MPDADELFYRWSVPDSRKRGGRRTLRWEMTEQNAAEWAASNGVNLEKMEGSGRARNSLGFDQWTGKLQGGEWPK